MDGDAETKDGTILSEFKVLRRDAPVCPTCSGYGNFYDCPDCLDGKAMPSVTQ